MRSIQTNSGPFSRIASFENLLAAYRRARRAGRSRPAEVAFDYDLEANLVTLRDDLLAGRQYEFAAEKLAEIGRLIGAWRKVTRAE